MKLERWHVTVYGRRYDNDRTVTLVMLMLSGKIRLHFHQTYITIMLHKN